MDEKHLNLIYSIVWEIHKRSGIDWDELFAEASLTYFVKMKKYEKARGSKVTWIFTCIRNRLQNFVQQEYNNSFLSIEYESVDIPVDVGALAIICQCTALHDPEHLTHPDNLYRDGFARNLA